MMGTRQTGLLVPLFSIPASRSWGIGEIADIEVFGAWLRAAGLDLWQLLPVNEMAEGQHSPYSALSAMAIDPIYISLHALEDFAALGGESAMDESSRLDLADARSARAIDYDTVRVLKDAALRASFDRFLEVEWAVGSPRAQSFEAFVERERWWLDDYALFRVLHARFGQRPWCEWDAPVRDRHPEALVREWFGDAREIQYRQYLQWVAGDQWGRARAACGVQLFGDFPFMVSSDSADVWAHEACFDRDASVGTPPDAFAKDGQDWGLPVYRWDRMRDANFAWLRDRARRCAALFDGYRVDHVVGFYRTYVRPPAGSPYFSPDAQADQVALGEDVLAVLASGGGRIVAEDLGTVPDYVHDSLARLGVPGFRVLRWERSWDAPGRPFIDPATYPPVSVATTGTHDTEPLAAWWDGLTKDDRAQVGALPAIRGLGVEWKTTAFTEAIREALVGLVLASGADIAVLPIQDVFGWRDRINVPGTINNENWTWRVPWSIDTLGDEPEALARAQGLRSMTRRHQRGAA